MAMLDHLFNESSYLQWNADVAEAVKLGLATAQQHFELYGHTEGRAPSLFFNPDEYLALYADVADAVAQGLTDAYTHFITYGIHENRTPFSGFDSDYYLTANPELKAALAGSDLSPVAHFLMYGVNELRNFNPLHDIRAYADAHPELAANGLQAMASFIQEFHLTDLPKLDTLDYGTPAIDPGTGGDPILSDDDLQAIIDSLTPLITAFGESINVLDLQQQILASGLVSPDKLGPDGTLIDPLPLIDFVWEYFYDTPFSVLFPDIAGSLGHG